MINIIKPNTSQNKSSQLSNQNLINNYLLYIYPSLSSKSSPEKILNALHSLCRIFSKNSPDLQKDLFFVLSQKGLSQILSYVTQSRNETIRKLSSKIIIELLYNNEKLQLRFCEQYNFTPIGKVICLNWVPKMVKDQLVIDQDLLYSIRESQNQKNPYGKYWQWPPNQKYTDEDYPDPHKYFIGFYLNTESNMKYEDKGYRTIDIGDIVNILEKGKNDEPNVASMTTSSSLTNHQKDKIVKNITLSENKVTFHNSNSNENKISKKNHYSRSIECKTERFSDTYAFTEGSKTINYTTINKLLGPKTFKFK